MRIIDSISYTIEDGSNVLLSKLTDEQFESFLNENFEVIESDGKWPLSEREKIMNMLVNSINSEFERVMKQIEESEHG